MDIPRDKDGMTIQDYHTLTLEEHNKSLKSLINICKTLHDAATINVKERYRLEKRIKVLENFVLGLFIINTIISIVLIIFLVTL
jgi:hypothetical protein